MKKTNKLLALLSASALLGLTFANTVNAQESTSSVSFEAGKDKNEVADPLNPTTPIKPESPANPDDPANKGTEAPGPLSIDYVSNFDFGVRTISSRDDKHTLSSKPGKAAQQTPFIQVTDNRGNPTGWNLTAKISSFTTTDGDTLPGAKLTIGSKNAKATAAFKNPNGAPEVNQSIVLESASVDQNLMNATSGNGAGTWINLIDPDKTELFIPGGHAKAKAYTATITWSLASGPQNASATQTNTDTASSENA